MSKSISIDLNLPAEFKHLNTLSASIAALLERIGDLQEAETVINYVQLAAQEVCTNIVKYAYAGQGGRIDITFTLTEHSRQLIIETWDSGLNTFHPPTVPDPQTDQLGGRGLFLIRRLMDEVIYYSGEGNAWMCADNSTWQPISPPHKCLGKEQNYWRISKTL